MPHPFQVHVLQNVHAFNNAHRTNVGRRRSDDLVVLVCSPHRFQLDRAVRSEIFQSHLTANVADGLDHFLGKRAFVKIVRPLLRNLLQGFRQLRLLEDRADWRQKTVWRKDAAPGRA